MTTKRAPRRIHLNKAEIFMELIYSRIQHGDEEHRVWLKKELMSMAPMLEQFIKLEESPKANGVDQSNSTKP